MSFILMADGRECRMTPFHQGPAPALDVIAHSLSQINRFAGHTLRPYSVAEHSLLVARIAAEQYGASPIVQLACLMHDAHECIVGDVSRPVKALIGDMWTAIENSAAHLVRQHYRLLTTFQASGHIIKACDLIALATERRDLLRYRPGTNLPWTVLDTPGAEVEPFQAADLMRPLDAQLWPEDWCSEFTGEYTRLRALVDEQVAAIPAHQP